jgi:hypothetical protein
VTVAVMVCCSIIGYFIPPFAILKERENFEFNNMMPPGIVVEMIREWPHQLLAFYYLVSAFLLA